MKLAGITPLILTYNEEPNLERCLNRLTWATRVIVLDSGSSDGTVNIAKRFGNATLLVRPFDDHTTQWNFGVEACESEWVLALDADYVLGAGFEQEMEQLQPMADAYEAAFRYLVGGQSLRTSLYPPRAVLFRKDRCRYIQDGHTQILHVPGNRGNLSTRIDHDDRKPLSRWVVSQDRYAALEAQKLLSTPSHELRLQDRLRRTGWAAIPATLIYTLLIKRTLFDGWRGWFYALQRTFAEILLALRLIEARFTRLPGPRKGP